MPKHKQAVLALIIANIIWGAASPIFKLALTNIPPFSLAFFRFLFASVIILPFCYNNLLIRKKHWLFLFLNSLFGVVINITFFFLGLQLAPSINAPIIASSGPVFIYLFSVLILHEKPYPKILSGLTVSLLGVLVIIGQPIVEHGLDIGLIGNIFFLLATLGTVGHAIASKEIISEYRAATVTFWTFLLGAIMFLPLFIGETQTLNLLSSLNMNGIGGLFFGIFFSSALAYFLYEWGIKNVKTQEVGLFTYIDPLIAILIALPLLHEKITPLFLIGGLLIFAGIYIAEGRINYHPLHKLRR